MNSRETIFMRAYRNKPAETVKWNKELLIVGYFEH